MTPPTATATVAILALAAVGFLYAVPAFCRLIGNLSRH